jgi:hypothetical protein
MKKIIDGFRYDTEKADKVCDIWEANPRDFKHIDAALYRTKRSGRFFIAGKGGPMTMFARRVDQNSWSGGSSLIPLTAEDARKYAEKYASDETIEKFFEVEEA